MLSDSTTHIPKNDFEEELPRAVPRGVRKEEELPPETSSRVVLPPAFQQQRVHIPAPGDTLHGFSVELLQEAVRQMPVEEREEMVRLGRSANSFKEMRIKFGFTQYDVGFAMGRRYGAEISQTTVSRYEACQLTYKNMQKLMPIFDTWITEAEASIIHGVSLLDIIQNGTKAIPNQPAPVVNIKKRKKRVNLDTQQHKSLEVVFCINPHPSRAYMDDLSEQLGLEYEKTRRSFQEEQASGDCSEYTGVDLEELVANAPGPSRKRSKHACAADGAGLYGPRMPYNTANTYKLIDPAAQKRSAAMVDNMDVDQPGPSRASNTTTHDAYAAYDVAEFMMKREARDENNN
ncbi:unnamed protein product, partial [Mesorhabditis spiculigera]